MKLAILSRAPRCYTTGRLRTAAADRDHTVKVLNTLRFGIDLSGPEPRRKREKVSLEPAFEEKAVRAAQIMGLRVAGVDMLEGADGPLVMEVNSAPGLEGIEAATKLDVAGAIIDYIDNQVAFPEIDVRQRLTVSRGYGVAEIVVHAASDLVGRPPEEMRSMIPVRRARRVKKLPKQPIHEI